MSGAGAPPGGGRGRPRVYRPPGAGRVRFSVRIGEDELTELRAAAALAGLTPSGYVVTAALSVARNTRPPMHSPARAALAGLTTANTDLRRIGTNLNQLVARFHATGQPPARLEEALRIVLAAADRVDAAAARVAARLP